MASLITRVRRRLASGETIVECRDCGTTLDIKVTTCPNCDSSEISHYELD